MKKKVYRYCRQIKTTQERRANQQCKYVRGKRRGGLPDPWDRDDFIRHQKSWKSKRKSQYYPGGRGKKHNVKHKCDWHEFREWDLEEYFQDNGIPYIVEPMTEISYRESWAYPGTYYRYNKIIGCDITWWSNKDIGIEYLIKRFTRLY